MVAIRARKINGEVWFNAHDVANLISLGKSKWFKETERQMREQIRETP